MNKKAILRSLQSEKLAVSMRHRNIVTIYHVNDRSDPAFVIMEYVGKRTSDGMYIHTTRSLCVTMLDYTDTNDNIILNFALLRHPIISEYIHYASNCKLARFQGAF